MTALVLLSIGAFSIVFAVLLVTKERLLPFVAISTVLLAVGLLMSRLQGRLVVSTLFLGLILVTDVDLYRGTGSGEALHPQVVLKLVAYAVATLIAMLWLRPNLGQRGGLICALYVGLCIASAGYSVDPLVSLSGGILLGCQAVLGLAIVSNYSSLQDLDRDLQLLGACFALKAFLSWTVALLAPDVGLSATASLFGESLGFDAPRLSGLSNPNVTGINAAFLLVISTALTTRTRTRPWRLFGVMGIVLGVLTLIGAQSRTSIVAAVAALASTFIVGKPRKWIAIALLTLVTAGALWEWNVSDVARISSRVGAEEETLSLNGRTQIWRASVNRLSDSWLFGYGYGSARVIVPSLSEIRSPRPFYSAHNVLVESLFNVGVIGTIALTWMIGAGAVRLYQGAEAEAQRADGANVLRGLLGLAVVVVVSGLTESGAAGILTVQGLMLFWLFGVSAWVARGDPETTTVTRGR